ncbi:MAG: hypothetical protein IK076_07125 [Bacteroidales bacterium]|nr:hypothetical protein [Bacteroidales bacterium]
MNKTLKTILTYAGIVLLFLFLAYAFVPQVLGGKVVNQSDITGYRSMSQETAVWNRANPDDPTYWTDAMFGGMPNTSFYLSEKGDWTQPLYNLLFKGKKPANWLFISLLGAFLLMLSIGIDTLLAIGGAVAVTFCSYNMQIIQVGHNTKMQAIALLPWVLAAVIFTYKSADKGSGGWKGWLPKTVVGAVLFGLALSFQIKANHQQITYYLALIIFVFVITFFIGLLRSKEGRSRIGRFFAASALLLVVGLAGIGTNTIKLAPLYEYTKYTMRGGSELSHPTGGEINEKGLQLDYATAWSYGWEELPNLMIPNFNGGSSAGSINPDKSEVVKLFKQSGQGYVKEIAKALPFYWGPQPFTAGPMYMGAITIFLFMLGLFLYKGKEKWWLLAATLLAVFLAVGNHMMWFTRLFFEYAPMYNKFRTVSMALVMLQFTLPMLGFLVLDRIMKQEFTKKEFLRAAWIALALTAGFCLVCILIPGIAGSFSSPSDSRMQDVIVDALKVDRRHLLVSDALWSMILILLTFVLILWAYKVPKDAPKSYAANPGIGKARRTEAMVGICLLVLANMFIIGKRYLRPEDFTTPRQFASHFNQRPVDKAVLEDPAPSYRVVDLSADIFNDTFTSYWHKSIGGYSPAKLQRYQDLIDYYLRNEISSIGASLQNVSTIKEAQAALPEMKVMSALNTKYLILGGEIPPMVNPNAYGTAWFVNGFVEAATPDDEIGLIASTDLRKAAIIGADFDVPTVPEPVEKTDTIFMTSYAPNELHYHYVAAADRAAVFSEIYYPDWKASVDGKEISLLRADWTFRAAVLPAGEHDLVMRFEPKIYSVSEKASRASSATLLVLLAAAGACLLVSRKKEEQ